MDPSLLTFLNSSGPESENALTELLNEHAEALIRRIVNAKLRVLPRDVETGQKQDAEDVYQEVLVQIIARLRDCSADPQNKAITDFRSYVAVVSYNTCAQQLRRKYPQRWRLKNRLRYLLTHEPAFAVWEASEREWFCGLAAWRDRDVARMSELQQFREQLNPIEGALRAGEGSQVVLTAIFTRVGKPIELDDLVNLVADLQGIKDQPATGEFDEQVGAMSLKRLTPQSARIATEVEQRFYLERLWTEICQLPLRQRTALLLNLKGAKGDSGIELLPHLGIANIRQIARAIEMPAQQLASLWNKLPLDDATIAEHLQSTRQQVINLRKSARDRLARRMSRI